MPSERPLFGPHQVGLGIDENHLKVVRARFVDSEPFRMDLFDGFDTLRVLTYSVSVAMIVKMLDRFEHVECVFGHEGILHGLGHVIAAQKLVADELLTAVKGLDDVRKEQILGRVADKAARFFVVKDAISHSKIYLLESPTMRRVIVGSANLSERAFSGKQAETVVVFDDDVAAWEHYSGEYEQVLATASSEMTMPDLRMAETPLEAVPVLRDAMASESGVTLYVGADAELAKIPTVIRRVENLAAGYNDVAKSLVQPKHGRLVLDRRTVGELIRLKRSQRTSENAEPPIWLSIHPEAGTVLLAGDLVDLRVDDEAVVQDVDLLIRYFENYRQGFVGDVEQLQRDYFLFMSWFFFAPFVCDFRNRAITGSGYIFDFPQFAVLFGKSNCGKTRLIETLMQAMFGYHRFIDTSNFTRTSLQALRATYKRFPAVFDDLERTRFRNHGPDVIKDEQFMLEEYPAFVMSMNADNHAFATEIRKRCLMIYTNASLPDHTEEAKRLYVSVRDIQQDLTTSLYRRYLHEVMKSLAGDELPTDILRFSSELICRLFADHSKEPLPSWCTPVSMSSYTARKYENVKAELRKLYQTNRSRWTVRGDDVILSVDSFEAHGLRQEIPDWLLSEGSKGGNIVMDRPGLEEFWGISVRRRWFGVG